MNRWQLDLELSLLKEQGFSDDEAYCIIAGIERNEEDERNIERVVRQNT